MEKYYEEHQLFQAQQLSRMEQLEQLRIQENAQRRAWEEEQNRHRVEREGYEDRWWMTTAVDQHMALNNAKILHDRERHHRNLMAGLPFQQHTPWFDYENLPVPQGPSDPSPHWPEMSGSSFVPIQPLPPAEGEPGPFDDWKDMMSSLTRYPYNPYPPKDPNEQYQR